MAEKILMPKMSDTMEEGVIAAWHKKVGDQLESGDVLAEIETDKATMEYEAFEEGTILYLAAEEGDTIAVDGLLAIIGEEGEDYQALLNDDSGGDSAPQEESKAASSNGSESSQKETQTQVKDEPKVTNAQVVLMPKMSDTMEEGVIAEWHKKVGDQVSTGDVLVEIETDKATMEYEAFEEGTLLHIVAESGESVPVDAPMCVIGEEGADYEAALRQHQQGGSSDDGGQMPDPTSSGSSSSDSNSSNGQGQKTASTTSSSTNGRIKASPLAKKLAQEKGYDLSQIDGSGDGGRIVKKDIESYVPSTKSEEKPKPEPAKAQPSKSAPSTASMPVGQEDYEEQPVSQMRKTIARRLSESKFTAPHFYLTMEIVMDEAMETRKKLNEVSPVKISFNDMIVKAAAVALRQHPQVNAAWMGDKLRFNKHIHVGVAVAVPEGLLVPVIRFADAKSLSQIASETKELAQKAKDKKLQPSEWEGNTFSVSNLGMFGIDEFTAIINPPDACILAIGTIKQTAVPKDGELVLGNVMKVTLSCDHRVVDGATGADFLKTLKELLESPVRMLV